MSSLFISSPETRKNLFLNVKIFSYLVLNLFNGTFCFSLTQYLLTTCFDNSVQAYAPSLYYTKYRCTLMSLKAFLCGCAIALCNMTLLLYQIKLNMSIIFYSFTFAFSNLFIVHPSLFSLLFVIIKTNI